MALVVSLFFSGWAGVGGGGVINIFSPKEHVLFRYNQSGDNKYTYIPPIPTSRGTPELVVPCSLTVEGAYVPPTIDLVKLKNIVII